MYAATGTRPDIAFATSTLVQYMQNPGRVHWEAVKRVVKYLKWSRDLELTYGGTNNGIQVYTDANHASQAHRHSISGYAFLIDGGVVSWSSKKQPLIAQSTTEAKYIVAAHATKEALWLQAFLGEVARLLMLPTTLQCDNQSAIALSKDSQYHARTKHIDLCFHFICEAVDNGTISLSYCPTEVMVADILTKPLLHPKVEKYTTALGLLLA